MVTKYAAAHRRFGGEGPRRELHHDAVRADGARHCRRPDPANIKAKAADPILAQFGKAGKGGVPMPNIPQMDSVWNDLGQAWVRSTKGAGAMPAKRPSRVRPGRSRRRSANAQEQGGRPPGAHATVFREHGDADCTRIGSAAGFPARAIARGIALFSGGAVTRQDRAALGLERARGLGAVRPRRAPPVTGRGGRRRGHRRDRLFVISRRGRCPRSS